MKRPDGIKIWTVVFWIIVWESIAILNSDNFLFVSLVDVSKRLVVLAGESEFWMSIGYSSLRIFLGIFISIITALVLAPLSHKTNWVKSLLYPLLVTIKSIPVASFIIFALVFISSNNLSILISVLIGFPIIYTNLLNGIENVDKNLIEMSKIFEIKGIKKAIYVYVPEVKSYFTAGLNLAIGMCWKAGIAAEVIGIPDGSIGEQLYLAKIQLDTADILAFTIVIIIVSIIFEKVILKLFDVSIERLLR
ncbi:MAG: ABC transporter permease subunit [Peptostreptococcaceae bacterium]|nr:ABC transporter permease subunit [Peptostreptococcaceae bacterium]